MGPEGEIRLDAQQAKVRTRRQPDVDVQRRRGQRYDTDILGRGRAHRDRDGGGRG